MFYWISFVVGVLLILPHTCNGQLYCQNNGCLAKAECSRVSSIDAYHCECYYGYRLNSSGICEDINECQWNVCATMQCENLPGSYNCVDNVCPRGYINKRPGCRDIDECRYNVCGPTGICKNYDSYYSCRCYSGYQISNGFCDDVDECLDLHSCDLNARCENFQGGYNCTCNAGFTGDGKTCTDVASPNPHAALPGDVASPTPHADSPGDITAIAVGSSFSVLGLAIVIVLVVFFTRRTKRKRKRERLGLSNRPIEDAQSHDRVRPPDADSTNGEGSFAVTGEIHSDAIEDMYSNHLIKERKRQQLELNKNISQDDVKVNGANKQRPSGDPYDTLWKASASQENSRLLAATGNETYNHLHQRAVAAPTTTDDGQAASLYNHVYSGGEVSQTSVIPSTTGFEIAESNDENGYSLVF